MAVTLENVHVDSPRDGVAVVALLAEHDLTTGDGLSQLLRDLVEQNDLVVVDFSATEFVDSSTLHVLFVTERLARARGATFLLELPAECAVRRTFEISGVLEQIAWAPSRVAALRGAH